MTIKLYRNFTISRTCSKYGVKDYDINEDGSIDVDGDVNLGWRKLYEIPLKFRNVKGDFHCQYNNLLSLEGSPETVSGSFTCHKNLLESLKGCPKRVGDAFVCQKNLIYSFDCFPEFIGGDMFSCSDNPIYEVYSIYPHKEFAEMLCEYQVIKGYDEIIEVRLRQALEDSGFKRFEDLETKRFKNYRLI